MSLAPSLPRWPLSESVRTQLIERGITRAQLLRLLQSPALRIPSARPGKLRISGYGLTAVIAGHNVLSVHVDGEDDLNWEEWAVDLAEVGDGDALGADALVRELADKLSVTPPPKRQPKTTTPRRTTEKRPAYANRKPTNILARINPRLREEITRQVDGDLSRLVVHSYNNVEILPPLRD